MKKLETKSVVLLKHHLKALKLPTMTAECEKAAARCAKENVDHLGFLRFSRSKVRGPGFSWPLAWPPSGGIILV